jgi:hypothetical protein
MNELHCRSCAKVLTRIFCDLGVSPLSNAFVEPDKVGEGERVYPLRVLVCEECLLVQLPALASPDSIFSEYAYFSSFAASWLKHSSAYCDDVIQRFKLGRHSQVIEVASNDGYLLQYFKAKSLPVLGVEPARNVARKATENGIPTISEFFGSALARRLVSEGKRANLLIGNNVLAHVPDLNDFVLGLATLLDPEGVLTLEFPHLLNLMAENQFDTIYHEHFSYFSYIAVETVMRRGGLRIFDVDRVSTHGGSLRIYCCHPSAGHRRTERVTALFRDEEKAGLGSLAAYDEFADTVRRAKRNILSFLIQLKTDGRTIAGYGAAAKGNTLLNYCGVGVDFIDFVADRNPYKQGRLLPGSHIPVCNPERIFHERPDYVFILAWNLKDEVVEQMAGIREWGGRFFTVIPNVQVIT